jgi:hypothetical protein
LNKQGVCLEKDWTYSKSTKPGAKYTKEPPKECYESALDNQILSYWRINANMFDIRACLADGYPFVFGFSVYSSFMSEEVAKTGIMPMPEKGESMLGGHAVMAAGYDNDRRLLLVRNSWGKEWGDKGCRTGAITENERGVAIYGENGYVFTGAIPESMKTAIRNCNDRSQHIVDLTVTDSGYWCVVWDRNNYDGNLPTEMSNMLRQYKRDGEEIYSVSICENGNFAIVTDKHYYASHETDNANMKRAAEKFGTIYSCCVTNRGIIVCCSRGVYYKDIPNNIETAMKKQSFRIKHAKYTDSGTYLITDGDKRRAWYM